MKKLAFESAFKKFENSTRNTQDYMDFMLAVRNSVAQGDGLLWSDLEEIVDKYLKNL